MFKRLFLIGLIVLVTACVPVTYESYIGANNMEGVEQHYQQGNDINRLDYWGTPLGYAARINNLEAATFLIDKGADVNRGNPEGYESKSPMHAAAAHGSVEIAKLLLANGADLTIRNRENQTPLQVAKAQNQPAMVALLNEHTLVDTTWKNTQKINTLAAYESFIEGYPDSVYQDKAEAKIQNLKAELLAEQQQQSKLAALEASLPATVRRDKYMIQLSTFLKEQDYQSALTVFPKLEQLPINKDPSLDFFYGEALLKTGNPTEALKKLYRYITQQGSGARHYTKALELINQAESQL